MDWISHTLLRTPAVNAPAPQESDDAQDEAQTSDTTGGAGVSPIGSLSGGQAPRGDDARDEAQTFDTAGGSEVSPIGSLSDGQSPRSDNAQNEARELVTSLIDSLFEGQSPGSDDAEDETQISDIGSELELSSVGSLSDDDGQSPQSSGTGSGFGTPRRGSLSDADSGGSSNGSQDSSNGSQDSSDSSRWSDVSASTQHSERMVQKRRSLPRLRTTAPTDGLTGAPPTDTLKPRPDDMRPDARRAGSTSKPRQGGLSRKARKSRLESVARKASPTSKSGQSNLASEPQQNASISSFSGADMVDPAAPQKALKPKDPNRLSPGNQSGGVPRRRLSLAEHYTLQHGKEPPQDFADYMKQAEKFHVELRRQIKDLSNRANEDRRRHDEDLHQRDLEIKALRKKVKKSHKKNLKRALSVPVILKPEDFSPMLDVSAPADDFPPILDVSGPEAQLIRIQKAEKAEKVEKPIIRRHSDTMKAMQQMLVEMMLLRVEVAQLYQEWQHMASLAANAYAESPTSSLMARSSFLKGIALYRLGIYWEATATFEASKQHTFENFKHNFGETPTQDTENKTDWAEVEVWLEKAKKAQIAEQSAGSRQSSLILFSPGNPRTDSILVAGAPTALNNELDFDSDFDSVRGFESRVASVQSLLASAARNPSVQDLFASVARPPSVQSWLANAARSPSIQGWLANVARSPSGQGLSASAVQSPQERQPRSAERGPEVRDPRLRDSSLNRRSPGRQQMYSPGTHQMYSPGTHQMYSPGTQQIYSPARQQTYSSARQQMYSPGTHQMYSPGTHQMYSPRTYQMYSPARQQMYSPGTHQTYSPGTHEMYSPGSFVEQPYQFFSGQGRPPSSPLARRPDNGGVRNNRDSMRRRATTAGARRQTLLRGLEGGTNASALRHSSALSRELEQIELGTVTEADLNTADEASKASADHTRNEKRPESKEDLQTESNSLISGSRLVEGDKTAEKSSLPSSFEHAKQLADKLQPFAFGQKESMSPATVPAAETFFNYEYPSQRGDNYLSRARGEQRDRSAPQAELDYSAEYLANLEKDGEAIPQEALKPERESTEQVHREPEASTTSDQTPINDLSSDAGDQNTTIAEAPVEKGGPDDLYDVEDGYVVRVPSSGPASGVSSPLTEMNGGSDVENMEWEVIEAYASSPPPEPLIVSEGAPRQGLEVEMPREREQEPEPPLDTIDEEKVARKIDAETSVGRTDEEEPTRQEGVMNELKAMSETEKDDEETNQRRQSAESPTSMNELKVMSETEKDDEETNQRRQSAESPTSVNELKVMSETEKDDEDKNQRRQSGESPTSGEGKGNNSKKTKKRKKKGRR